MNQKKPTPKYTAEFRERGVRLYREQRSGLLPVSWTAG